jgi:hypothetical protein
MSFDLPIQEVQEKSEREARQIKLSENTSYYINTYLNPYGGWDRYCSAKQRIDLLKNADVNWATVSKHIKGMEYRDFLETPYWKAIAAHTKFRAGYRCQLCNSRMGLVTHHRDYGIHGREHAHIYDLIVLCSYCHQKFHDSEGKKIRSYNSNYKSRLILLGLIVLGVAYFLISGKV